MKKSGEEAVPLSRETDKTDLRDLKLAIPNFQEAIIEGMSPVTLQGTESSGAIRSFRLSFGIENNFKRNLGKIFDGLYIFNESNNTFVHEDKDARIFRIGKGNGLGRWVVQSDSNSIYLSNEKTHEFPNKIKPLPHLSGYGRAAKRTTLGWPPALRVIKVKIPNNLPFENALEKSHIIGHVTDGEEEIIYYDKEYVGYTKIFLIGNVVESSQDYFISADKSNQTAQTNLNNENINFYFYALCRTDNHFDKAIELGKTLEFYFTFHDKRVECSFGLLQQQTKPQQNAGLMIWTRTAWSGMIFMTFFNQLTVMLDYRH